MVQRPSGASHSNIHELATSLGLSDRAYTRALQLADLTPDRSDWRQYINHFLVAVGTLLIIAGVTAFFAWNWADLSYMLKFALIQSGIVVLVLFAWRLGIDSVGGRAGLLASAMLVGVLLAVFGQVYQTGADPYSLFVGWAVLILPWVLVGRQAGLWILLQMLLNLALVMYWTQVIDPPDGWWQLSQLLGPLVWLSSTLMNSTLASLVFALNVIALIAWEYSSTRNVAWMRGRTYPRVMGFIAFSTALIPTVLMIIGASLEERGHIGVISPVLYTAATGTALIYYQFRRPDLLMLTMCVFGLVLVVTTVFIRYLISDVGGLLLLAVLLIAQVAGAAYWLRSVSRKWEARA